MFKKILNKLQDKPSYPRAPISTTTIPYLDLDGEDKEDDGFLLIGQTKAERSTTGSVENSLDLPPSYESVRGLPVYSDLFPDKMGSRNTKQEIFEPTLHAAGRQTSQEAAAATQNDILTPYFESLQSERQKGGSTENVRAETSPLCGTAASGLQNGGGPSNASSAYEAVGGTSQQTSTPNVGAAGARFSSAASVSTPYEDIPFKLTAGLVNDGGKPSVDLNAVNENMKRGGQSLQYRYTYDFTLERSVLTG